MTSLVRTLSRAVACRLGLHHVARRWNHRRLVILCYHGIARPGDPADWLLMPGAVFARQLCYLAKHYDVRNIDEALADLWAGKLDRATACITFDDGYVNNVTEALPRLTNVGVPATIYLATGLVDTDRIVWTTEIQVAVQHTLARRVDLEGLGDGYVIPADSARRHDLARRLIARLKTLTADARRAEHRRLVGALGAPPAAALEPFRLMSWDDARRLSRAGVTFGGHTVEHAIVSRLETTELVQEIGCSMRSIREQGLAVTATFAYPNGTLADYDARAKAAVAANGGVAAVTTVGGLNGRDTDRFALRRVTLGGGVTYDEFRLQVSGVRRPTIPFRAAGGV